MNKTLTTIAAACAALAASTASVAAEGPWAVRVGGHYVDPKSDNSDIVTVEGAFSLTGSVEYFVTPQIAVDLLVAVPFKHDIKLKDGGEKVGSTRHLPPTLSLVWYPDVSKTLHPFIGAGINYTTFFDEKTRGALEGADLKLDDSFGIAGVVGLAVDVAPRWSVVADVRYFDIDTKAKVNGESIGDVAIDPLGYGVSVGYRF